MQSQTHRARPGGARTTPHSVRTTESLWLSAKRRADSEGVTMGYMITELMEGYARGLMTLPKTKAGKTTAKREAGHSVRATDELWNATKRAAGQEGLTMNDVVESILSGYSRGLMDLPKVAKTFIATKKAAASS